MIWKENEHYYDIYYQKRFFAYDMITSIFLLSQSIWVVSLQNSSDHQIIFHVSDDEKSNYFSLV